MSLAATTALQNLSNTLTSDSQRNSSPPSFWDLPREIRDMIYSYVLSSDHKNDRYDHLVPLDDETREELDECWYDLEVIKAKHSDMLRASRAHRRYNCYRDYKDTKEELEQLLAQRQLWNLQILDMSIVRTCRQVCAEVQDYINRRVVVVVRTYRDRAYSDRELAAITTAQRLYLGIFVDIFPGCNAAPPAWAEQLQKALRSRTDVQLLGVHFSTRSKGEVLRAYDGLEDGNDALVRDSGESLRDCLAAVPVVHAGLYVLLEFEGFFATDEVKEEIWKLEEERARMR